MRAREKRPAVDYPTEPAVAKKASPAQVLREHIADLETVKAGMSGRIAELEADLKVARDGCRTSESRVAALQEQAERVDDLEEKLDRANSELGGLRFEVNRMKAEGEALAKKLDHKGEAICALKAQVLDLTVRLARAQGYVDRVLEDDAEAQGPKAVVQEVDVPRRRGPARADGETTRSIIDRISGHRGSYGGSDEHRTPWHDL